MSTALKRSKKFLLEIDGYDENVLREELARFGISLIRADENEDGDFLFILEETTRDT